MFQAILFKDAIDDMIRIGSVCKKSNYVPPASDPQISVHRNRRLANEENIEAPDWMDDLSQWKILNQFIWYQAQTALMEIYRRDGVYKMKKNGTKKKTCQQMGDKIVSYNSIKL